MRSPHIPEPQIDPTAVIAPNSHIFGDVVIGEDSFVLFGTVIRAEVDRIEIGKQTNVQDNSVIHCDENMPCLIGDRATLGHSVVVHAATVGDRCLIGIGARLLNRSIVGEGAWVAAGSVLTEGSEIPPWTLAVGTPARPLRELTVEEIRRADEGVDHYLELANAYREIFSNVL
ncbi:MAG: gamma carbonic anhydrase family protein [Acidimicrobiia bacterium]